jgi:hypothetical protein
LALLRIITFLIHAIVFAMASMLGAVFTHFLPAFLAVVALCALVFGLCATCGVGGLAIFRRRGKD